MPAVVPIDNLLPQLMNNTGAPLAGGKLFAFAAGTSTPQATYTDSTGSVQNANPVILDSAGRASIWLNVGLAYKFTLQTSAGVQLWTEDNINPGAVPASLAATNVTGALTLQQPTAATGGANQSSNILEVDANYWTGAVSALDKWTIQDVLGTGSNPTSTLTLTHAGTSGASTIGLPSLNVSGPLTAQSISGELEVGNGVGQYPSIAAGYAALAAGQTLVVPNNWSDPNWVANLVINKNHTCIRFTGDATINMQTFQITMASSVAGFQIIAPGCSQATSAGVRFLYTGTGSAFAIGDGSSSTSGIYFQGFTINLVGAGSAAIGLTLSQVVFSIFVGVQVFGANGAITQVGFLLNDGGGVVGTIDNTFINSRVTNCKFGIRFVPTSTGGASNNTFQTVNIGTSVAANVGIDFQAAATGNYFANADLNGLATAINFAAVATVNNNRFVAAFLQNNTVDVAAGAGCHDNFVDPVGNVTVTVNDSGTNNSFLGLTTQLKVGSGLVTRPAVNIGGTAGFYNSAGVTIWTDGTFGRMSIGAGAGGEVGVRSNGTFAWAATGGPETAADTAISRINPGVISLGNGTQGDITGQVVLNQVTEQTANAAQWVHGQNSELLTLSTVGTTTDTVGTLLPANAIIESVVARVTTTITTATNWSLGDSVQANRFTAAQSGAQLTAGATVVGLNQADPTVASANLGPVQVSAAKVRVTTTGTPGAGVIRITVFFRQFVAPTS